MVSSPLSSAGPPQQRPLGPAPYTGGGAGGGGARPLHSPYSQVEYS